MELTRPTLFQIEGLNGTSLESLISELCSFPHAVGEPVALFSDACPSKCVPLEGESFSATEFEELFLVYGYRYGGGDGTFHVPYMRGLVLKGWNHGKATGIYDLEAATRTDRGDGTTGDNVGTLQKFRMQGWQLGGARSGNSYYGIIKETNYDNAYSAAATYGGITSATGQQGAATKLTGVSDGVNGPPLVGKQTNDSNISVLWVTRYTW